MVFLVFIIDYDDNKRVENFRMIKSTLFRIVNQLWPMLMKQNTQYPSVIHVEIWVSCVIYNLAHGVNLLICNKCFAIGKSIVSLMLHEFVEVANIIFKKLILWPTRTKINVTIEGFGHLCGLSSVHGAIDGAHIQIPKP
jgi:hypothetical protein